MENIIVDPQVSRKKFDREVKNLMNISQELRKKGWLIETTSFPVVRVSFIAIELKPLVIPLTIDINFTNYNIVPPSVRFLHPVTLEPMFIPGFQLSHEGKPQKVIIEGHPITKEPFICLPRVQEYHSHPQHNGDSWDLYRYPDSGCLYYILDNIWRYCIKSIKDYQANLRLNNLGYFLEAQP